MQGPKPDERNTADFWRMVWETKAKAIIMATGVTEGGVEKCARSVRPFFLSSPLGLALSLFSPTFPSVAFV